MQFTPSRQEQLTDKQMKWGYWWLSHKLQLKAVLTILIGLIGIVSVSYSVYGFADWYFGSGVAERAAIAQMAQTPTGYGEINERNAPQDLMLDAPTVLLSGSGSYDIFVEGVNPNDDWIAEMEWHFVSDGLPIGDIRKATVMPGSGKPLVHLGFKSESRPTDVDLVIDKFSWRRLNKHEIKPNWATWSAERMDIRIDDVSFSPPAVGDILSVSRATFLAVNDTGYGYWRVGFFVTLWEQSKLIGVNYVTVSELLPGESRPVDASWFTSLPSVTRVVVTPDINLFDVANYMPVSR